MKVVVKLESLLMAEALAAHLQGENEEDTVLVDRGSDDAGPDPDVIIADSKSIGQVLERWPQGKVILLDTGLQQEELITLFLLHNPDGILSTEADTDLARKALKLVHAGQIWIDHGNLKSLLFTAGTVYQNQKVKKVSAREQEVLDQLTCGKKNKEIADILCISEQTVKSHLSRIFKKFNVSTRHQLMSQLAGVGEKSPGSP